MPGNRDLWTGPFGSALRDRALRHAPVDPSGLWVVPSAMARDQVVRVLGLRRRVACHLRVWCWADLWRATRLGSRGTPMLLSSAGGRAALREAIDQARRDGLLDAIGEVAQSLGFLRRLRGRIAAWTRL